uniref:Ttk protein kinase n=1 Tax=Gadus morhua TaxID=8049 RepID=A0A8C5CG87_GADMO
MEEEEHTDREQQRAMFFRKLDKLKKNLNEDDTDNINQVIGSNSPESCLTFLLDLEKKSDPNLDHNHLTRLLDFHTRVFSSLPMRKHCLNESYARLLVRYAELEAIQDVNEAEAHFIVATSHSQNFAFVHVAYANFEHAQGNTRKSINILLKAMELNAKPKDLLALVLKKLQKTTVDKENLQGRFLMCNTFLLTMDLHPSVKFKSKISTQYLIFLVWFIFHNETSSVNTFNEPVQRGSECEKMGSKSDGTGEFQLQTSGSSSSAMGTLTSAKKLTVGGDFLNFKVSPHLIYDHITLTLNQMVSSNSPKSCWDYLLKLEKTGNPQTDRTLLTQLKDCYAKVFSRLPIEQYTKNESYAKILVRYAELKGIEDSDDAKDHFIVARSNCKYFAFVHIAHAQFEASQGNIKKATSILSNAQALNAKPPRLLELALQNLKAGAKRLVPKEEEEEQSPVGVQFQSQGLSGFIPRPLDSIPIPALHVPTPVLPIPTPLLCQLAFSAKLSMSSLFYSFVTPSVRKDPPDVAFSASQSACAAQPPSTPVKQVSYSHIQQVNPIPISHRALSNESITIKGKEYFILKMIGQGGSSKVYQALDHKKQLYAVKCVNLEEADPQTVESYKNEIEHLMRLQQFSDQIIKLYDYEITDRYIYMLMECGNLDLNTWLRNRKKVLPLERKYYWKNMLEAVHTIHSHGIIHSDLKPANFVIVNASLKLIDFGIANSIQPDVTSIMKDSPVGTLNYMPPEAIKDTSSQPGKASSKISPKGDVWSLGCILYCMTYRRTPFQSITNQIAKLQAIMDPSHKIEFPDIAERDLQDVLKRCLVRNPRERISIAELLEHAYLQLDSQPSPETRLPNSDLERILTDLAALNSPNSIVRAANNLAKMCNSGRRLDVAECVKSSSQLSWKM